MPDVEGSQTFRPGGSAYDAFMGRYYGDLAAPFADFAGSVVAPGFWMSAVEPGH